MPTIGSEIYHGSLNGNIKNAQQNIALTIKWTTIKLKRHIFQNIILKPVYRVELLDTQLRVGVLPGSHTGDEFNTNNRLDKTESRRNNDTLIHIEVLPYIIH